MLAGALLLAIWQAGARGCTLGTVDPYKALELVVTVTKSEASAQLKLSLTNTGDTMIALRFNTGQRFDLLAREKETGRYLWRWSFRKAFTQALGSEEFQPGESRHYDAEMPYEGLPPARYEIHGFITTAPPIKAREPALLDLTEKTIQKTELHVIGEIHIDETANPPGLYINSLHGAQYELTGAPDVFRDAKGYALEAWLLGSQPPYGVADYLWVLAPMPENGELFLNQFVFYRRTGGIAGIHEGIKIFGDGSFMANCCLGSAQIRTGYVGSFEGLLQFLTAQKITYIRDHYGKPGQVADGFHEYLQVKTRVYQKTITVHQDPGDPPPESFARIVSRLRQLVGVD
jgi:hypothetical protein